MNLIWLAVEAINHTVQYISEPRLRNDVEGNMKKYGCAVVFIETKNKTLQRNVSQNCGSKTKKAYKA